MIIYDENNAYRKNIFGSHFDFFALFNGVPIGDDGQNNPNHITKTNGNLYEVTTDATMLICWDHNFISGSANNRTLSSNICLNSGTATHWLLYNYHNWTSPGETIGSTSVDLTALYISGNTVRPGSILTGRMGTASNNDIVLSSDMTFVQGEYYEYQSSPGTFMVNSS